LSQIVWLLTVCWSLDRRFRAYSAVALMRLDWCITLLPERSTCAHDRQRQRWTSQHLTACIRKFGWYANSTFQCRGNDYNPRRVRWACPDELGNDTEIENRLARATLGRVRDSMPPLASMRQCNLRDRIDDADIGLAEMLAPSNRFERFLLNRSVRGKAY
jgi:hypothetical protein